MAQGFLTVTTDAVRTRAVTSAPRESGRLRAVGISAIAPGAEPMQIYARASLAIGGTDEGNVAIPLCEGYIGHRCGISWSGNIPLGGGMLIMLEAFGSGVSQVYMTSITDDAFTDATPVKTQG